MKDRYPEAAGSMSTTVQVGVLSPLGVSLGVWVLQLTIIVLLWRRQSGACHAAVDE
jgi:hypothetical protein